MQIQPRFLKLWCFLYFMNEKFNKNAKVEKLTKKVGRGVRLIVIGPYVSECWRDLQFCTLSKESLHELYEKLVPSNKRVVQIMQFPEVMTSQTSDTSKYLKRYIRELDSNSLGRFLRYCTGSDLLISEKITVEFTKMQGFERRPVAHTCGCLLQLADQFDNFMEFRDEFNRVLESNIWVMDII